MDDTPPNPLHAPCATAPAGLADTILSEAPIGIFRSTIEGRYLYANAYLAQLSGYGRPEAMLAAVTDITSQIYVAPPRRTELIALLAAEGRATDFEYERRLADGSSRWVAVSARALRGASDRLWGMEGFVTDIDARRRAEASLRENEADLRAILENTEDLVLRFDRRCRILYANPALRRYLPAPARAFLGRTPSQIGFPPPQARQIESEIGEAIASGRPMEREFIWPRPEGQLVFNVRLSAEGGADGREPTVLAFARDVTAQRRLERDFLYLFSQMAEGLALHEVISDATGEPTDYRFLAVNPAFERMTGLSSTDIIGRTVREVLPGTEDFWIRTYGRVALSGEPARFTGFSGAIGRYFEVSAYCPQPGQFAVIFSDVTDRKTMLDDMIAAKDRAEAASRAKSEFLANMSHEIRTPLSGIFGMLRLVLDSDLTPAQREDLTTALSTGNSLLAILNDILDFSRMEAGELPLENRPFDLRASLKVVLDNFRLAAEEKDLALGAEVAPELPRMVIGDEGRVRQVLFNLVGNAIKFTPAGSVRVTMNAPGNAPAGRLRLALSVADTGIGIPADRLGDIFQPFTQVDGSYTRRYQGTGLGLGIVKRLVALMGGTIAIQSEPGAGTTVCCTLLLGAGSAAPAADPTADADAPALKPRRILLAEDDRLNRLAVSRLLETMGHEVSCVENGRQAVEAVAAGAFDCVLMDVQMPGMDGLAATRAIRALPGAAARTPIIALTAHALKDDRAAFLAAGMNDYVSKPVERAQLLRALAAATCPGLPPHP